MILKVGTNIWFSLQYMVLSGSYELLSGRILVSVTYHVLRDFKFGRKGRRTKLNGGIKLYFIWLELDET